MKSSMIEIAIGNPIKFEDDRIGILRDLKMTPNGMNDRSIVTILFVEMEGGGIMSATANRFTPVDDFEYEELYPSVHLNRLNDKLFNQ